MGMADDTIGNGAKQVVGHPGIVGSNDDHAHTRFLGKFKNFGSRGYTRSCVPNSSVDRSTRNFFFMRERTRQLVDIVVLDKHGFKVIR